MIERQQSLVPVKEQAMTPYDADVAEADRPVARADAEDRGKAGGAGDAPSPPRKRVGLLVGAVILALAGWGIWTHWQSHETAQAAQQQQQDFVPEVRTAKAKKIDTPVELTQPGQTVAFDTANVFARSTGYIAERRVDIGSRVHKGDLLIRIAAPDLDQQLVQAQAQLGQNEAAILQAKANLEQAQATVKLANITKSRTTTLANQGWETKQNADNTIASAATGAAGVNSAEAGIAVAVANLRAQQATVQRLQELTGFEQVTAPFDGVVTSRNVDTGDLVTADNGSGTPMISLARDDILRVAVYVPQSDAVSIHPGLKARVTIPELPGRTFDATISRTSSALDPTSRSLLSEVDVRNPEGALRSGLYVNVTVEIPRQKPGVIVPDEALVFNADGLQVASIDAQEHAHYHKVSIYRDFGTSAELNDGLNGDETLVLSPPPNLGDGQLVREAPPTNQQNANQPKPT